MQTKEEAIRLCLSVDRKDVYEDYPFHDENWAVIRHRKNKKMFAAVYRHMNRIWINVKCRPDVAYMWRSVYQSVVPAYHMNKTHWNSIILDGSIPKEEIFNMIKDSYELTK